MAASSPAQHLEDGAWVGRIIHLTGRSMDVVYQVRGGAEGPIITMEVDGYGPFEFKNIRSTSDSLRFTWEPSFELACSLARLEGGEFQGACMDPWGGFGGIVMAPPGSNVGAIAIHDETIESIAGWTEPPKGDTLPDLGSTYPFGRQVMVHGREVNLVEAGDGPVTVVLEAGLGDNLSSFERLHQLLALDVRVVAYDRAGLGFSEASAAPRSLEQVATELRGMLREAGIAPPYVLVAHAEGALYAQRFAALYQDAVVGMVLVDPHLETFATTWRALDAESLEHYWEGRKALHQHMPSAVQAEFAGYVDVIEKGHLDGSDRLLSLPVTVLTAGRISEQPRWVGESATGREAWVEAHAAWVRRIDGNHIVVPGSGSYIHQEQPVRVMQAIHALLREKSVSIDR